MPIKYLERRDPSRNMARAYAAHVEPTLFGEWALIRQWGRIGASGRRREEWFNTCEEATNACAQIILRKRRRGYVSYP
jgi:predicted DNA-binding WGR domain protein